MDAANLRYIVMLIDSKHKDHDGKVFSDIREAREMVRDVVNDGYADKAVIGTFYMEPNLSESPVTMVETIGFRSDKTKPEQLNLF